MHLEGSMSALIQLLSRHFPSFTSRATSSICCQGLAVNPLPPTYQIFIATLFLLQSILFLTCRFINAGVNIHLLFIRNSRRESVLGIMTQVFLSTQVLFSTQVFLLDTGFSRFPCVYKQTLRRFPTFQVATTCFSCSTPDLNLVVTNFMFRLHVK